MYLSIPRTDVVWFFFIVDILELDPNVLVLNGTPNTRSTLEIYRSTSAQQMCQQLAMTLMKLY